MSTVLIIDDEPAIRESIAFALARDGFQTREADSLGAAAAAMGEAVDLVVLDLMLPDGSGLDFLKKLRTTTRLPVIVLTSRDTEADCVVGLELGADDYVLKPFSPRELVARVRAVLRRTTLEPATGKAGAAAAGPGGLSLNAETRRAMVGGRELPLSKTEFDLLAALLSAPGRVFTRSQLLDRVWGNDSHVEDRTVDVHVKSLRRKVGEGGGDPELIETVRGVGYRLREPG